MLVAKKSINDQIERVYFDSSNIIASDFDKTNNTLRVYFSHGGTYDYIDVSNTDYTRFILAESQGKVLNSHIKNYKTNKIQIEQPNFKLELDEIKKEEMKSLLFSTKSKIVTVSNSLDINSLDNIEEDVKKVFELYSFIGMFVSQYKRI